MRGSYFVLVILRKLGPNKHNLLVNEKACVVLGKFHSFSLCGNPIRQNDRFHSIQWSPTCSSDSCIPLWPFIFLYKSPENQFNSLNPLATTTHSVHAGI